MTNAEFKEVLISRPLALARKVIHLVEKFPNNRASWIIADQLVRSITSIGANIVEVISKPTCVIARNVATKQS